MGPSNCLRFLIGAGDRLRDLDKLFANLYPEFKRVQRNLLSVKAFQSKLVYYMIGN